MPLTFWLVGAGMLLPAMLILSYPLWGRGGGARHATIAVAAVVVVAVGGVAVYTPQSFNYAAAAAAVETVERLEAEYAARVEALREALRADDGAVETWVALGEAHAGAGRYALASSAYAEAERRGDLSPESRYAYAEAIVLSREESLLDRARRLLDSILEDQARVMRPQYLAALWLSGVVYDDRGLYAEAAREWRALLELLPDDADKDMRERLLAGIRAAESRVNGEASSSLKVNVSLAGHLRDKVGEGDVLLVYAKAVDGPPMPLAVVRTTVGDMPATVTLDRSSAMVGGLTMDAFERLVVTARISKTGRATPQSGDLFGASAEFAVAGADELRVEIDRVVP